MKNNKDHLYYCTELRKYVKLFIVKCTLECSANSVSIIRKLRLSGPGYFLLNKKKENNEAENLEQSSRKKSTCPVVLFFFY